MRGRAQGVLEAGRGEFLGPAAAAWHDGTLDDVDAQPGGTQRDGGSQAIRAAADDDRVDITGHRRHQTWSPLGPVLWAPCFGRRALGAVLWAPCFGRRASVGALCPPAARREWRREG